MLRCESTQQNLEHRMQGILTEGEG